MSACAQKGPPWRVEVAIGNDPPLTLLLDREEDDWRVVAIELPEQGDVGALLVKAGEGWADYVCRAREVLLWPIEKAVAEAAEARSRTLKGRGHETGFYKLVAEQYREFVNRSERPTSSIAAAHGVSRSTASRWVRRARKLGFLRPAPGARRAGERDA